MLALLVTQDDELRRVIEMATPLEYEVRVCATAVEAMSRLAVRHAHALLLDLDLGGGGAADLARAVRALPHPPAVIVMSSCHDRIEACVGVAHAFLAKPFMLTTLRAAVRRASVRAGMVSSSN